MDSLSHVLSRFAVSMLGASSIQAMLDRVVRESVDMLQFDGAGALLLSTLTAPEYIAASDATTLELERLQSTLRQGPGISAHDSAISVSVPDLALTKEFPEFTAAARSRGLRGVFTFPLRQGDVCLGALDLYRTSPGTPGDAELLEAQALADVLTACVINAQTRAALEATVQREHDAAHQQQALNDERRHSVATLVHEIGNPVASIAGFTELLEQEADDLSDRQRHYVSAIHRNSDRVRALTADMLTLFSLDFSPSARPHTKVDLRAVVAVARSILMCAPTAPALDVHFHVPSRSVFVRGHAEHLERMLSNLVSNAVKYTPPGGTVTCTLSQQDGHATLEVRDTGIGIPEAEQGELFTSFFRASTATELGIPGTGLGLAIVKSVVQGHDGTVSVSSASGTGTRVSVRLPITGETVGSAGHPHEGS